jgi:hypothetical protein
MPDPRFVFLGGLHRSGTSILHECLREHPGASAFRGTDAPEDEGQHLQSVYLPAKAYGGPGKFGFHAEAHLTEASPLVSQDSLDNLYAAWSQYWDTGKRVLLEKSPPNLIRSRFLQALFPNSYFVMIVRHPIAVSYATQKWSDTSLPSLLEHWLLCHKLFEQDRPHLKHVLVIRYEDFVADPALWLGKVYSFLGLDLWPCTLRVEGANAKYFAMWDRNRRRPPGRHTADVLVQRFEQRVNRFGYSLGHCGDNLP